MTVVVSIRRASLEDVETLVDLCDLSEFLSFLLTHKWSSDWLVSWVDGNRAAWRNLRF